MDQIKQRLDRLERQTDTLAKESRTQKEQINERVKHLEEISAARGERMDSLGNSIGNLQSHLYRMENSLLQEFKISQEIMKSMLDHDMSIEKAKFDFKMELERKQKEIENIQEKQKIDMARQRAEFRRSLYIKLGAVGLPIVTALATGISWAIENFFK